MQSLHLPVAVLPGVCRAGRRHGLQRTALTAPCRRQPWPCRALSDLQIPNEPDFDDLELDDDYYREMGMDEDELEAQTLHHADDTGAQMQTDTSSAVYGRRAAKSSQSNPQTHVQQIRRGVR